MLRETPKGSSPARIFRHGHFPSPLLPPSPRPPSLIASGVPLPVAVAYLCAVGDTHPSSCVVPHRPPPHASGDWQPLPASTLVPGLSGLHLALHPFLPPSLLAVRLRDDGFTGGGGSHVRPPFPRAFRTREVRRLGREGGTEGGREGGTEGRTVQDFEDIHEYVKLYFWNAMRIRSHSSLLLPFPWIVKPSCMP